jgi:hypothetical protein
LKIGLPYGVRFKEFPDTLNRFFKKHKIKLRAEGHAFGNFDDATRLVQKNINKGNDVLINFHWKPLGKKGHGHYVLASEIKNSILTVCDPSPNQPAHWKAPIKKFVQSMHSRYGQTRGFITINRI